jgi:hypothetical protein
MASASEELYIEKYSAQNSSNPKDLGRKRQPLFLLRMRFCTNVILFNYGSLNSFMGVCVPTALLGNNTAYKKR